MAIDPTNAHELAHVAGDIGADVMEGALRYLSGSGGWPLNGTMPKSTSHTRVSFSADHPTNELRMDVARRG
jgi:hypothetical protein